MRVRTWVVAALLLAFGSADATAEAVLAGKYKGSYVLASRTGNADVGITLDVKEVSKDGKVKAEVLMSNNGTCDGTYPMGGNVAASNLSLKSTRKSGRAGDCSFGMNLRLAGDKLVGKTSGGRAITLSK